MIYVAFIKDETAVAVSQCNNLKELKEISRLYDDVVEITKDVFGSIDLPAKLIDGVWTKTDNTPKVNYPQHVDPGPETPEEDSSVYDELAAAYRQGVQEA